MSTLKQAKREVVDFLTAHFGSDVELRMSDIIPPPNRDLGDLAFGCFAASKTFKKSPAAIAQEVAAKFQSTSLVAAAIAAGPYLNFKLNHAAFAAAVLKEALGQPEKWGESTPEDSVPGTEGTVRGSAETVMIEYAQPNTHKELHVGHLRNLTLGLAMVNLRRSAGQTVIPTCYIGDIGAHVAKCLWCLKKFHADELQSPPPDKGAWLGRIYTEATRRVDEDAALKNEVFETQRKLEARDPDWNALWEQTRDWSLQEFRNYFDQLGIQLDRWYLESEVEEAGKQTAQDLLNKGIAEVGEKRENAAPEERGALIVNLEAEGQGIALILKSDGSALYMTKELALFKLKFVQYPEISHSIHVVDSRQSLYFRQFFAILKKMGVNKKLTHLSYEFVTLQDGAMSSRQGNVVTYRGFRDQMVTRAKEETKKRRGDDWDEAKIDDTAWAVAEGAMKFGMLKQDPDKPIIFDIGQALSFDGFTGPYLQYAHARLCSILRKGGWGDDGQGNGHRGRLTSGLKNDEKAKTQDVTPPEFAVLAVAARLPETVAVAADQNKPSILAQYLFDLAQAISDFYRDVPVLQASTEEEKQRRLVITECLRLTLQRGLEILGMKAPREM